MVMLNAKSTRNHHLLIVQAKEGQGVCRVQQSIHAAQEELRPVLCALPGLPEALGRGQVPKEELPNLVPEPDYLLGAAERLVWRLAKLVDSLHRIRHTLSPSHFDETALIFGTVKTWLCETYRLMLPPSLKVLLNHISLCRSSQQVEAGTAHFLLRQSAASSDKMQPRSLGRIFSWSSAASQAPLH